MKVLHVDHIGITVNDMDAAKGFFVNLGFADMGETTVQGDWVGKIIGLKDVRSDVVMLSAPDGQVNLELSKFHHPKAVEGDKSAAVNALGLRHISFQVDDVEAMVESLKSSGIELVGEIYNYQDSWKLCYIRGPEEIIVELAQKLN